MVAIPTGLAINTPVVEDRTTASGFRKVLAALFAGSAVGAPASGILSGPGTPLKVEPSTTAMEYLVRAGYALTVRTNQGAYIVGTDDDLTIPTAVADGSNPRIDILYIVQPDPELSEAGVARIDVVSGAPGASPEVPALPAGALELGRKVVPAGASNAAEGSAVSNRPATTGLRVGWSAVDGKPTEFTPAAHNHSASQITNPSALSVGDSAKVGGHRVFVEPTEPASPAENDLWFW